MFAGNGEGNQREGSIDDLRAVQRSCGSSARTSDHFTRDEVDFAFFSLF